MLSLNTLLNLAYQEAIKSPHKQKMGAVIFDKNIVISTGYNKPLAHKRKLHPKFKRYPNSIHAEADAILKAKTTLKGSSMLVVRLDAESNFTMAKPCPYCMDYINYVNIRTVYFTISENELENCTIGILKKNQPLTTKIYKY